MMDRKSDQAGRYAYHEHDHAEANCTGRAADCVANQFPLDHFRLPRFSARAYSHQEMPPVLRIPRVLIVLRSLRWLPAGDQDTYANHIPTLPPIGKFPLRPNFGPHMDRRMFRYLRLPLADVLQHLPNTAT
jgi:hypothetical protein